DRLAEWLLATRRDGETGSEWPMFITDDPDAPLSGYGDPSWCYGTSGISWALKLAAEIRGRDDWEGLAESALDAAVAAADRLPDTGLCHGLAGLAHILWRFDPQRYAGAIDDIVDRILEAYSPEAPFGFTFHGDGGRIDHPGFIDGAAGVALALHRYARDAEPKVGWDSLMML
ncbi:MAG: lanthionine synthetase LanC family protein, partial [Stackebrandtia sp.]